MLAVYQMVLFGGMALGSWLWGLGAELYGVLPALLAAGSVMLGQLLLQPLLALPSGRPPDMRPAGRREGFTPEVPVAEGEGPVMLQVEYRIAPDDAPAFLAAMDDLGHQRRRNGALRWRLFQDVADAGHWIETFLVSDWLDQRRLLERTTTEDLATQKRAFAFHRGSGPPLIRRMIARRQDSRFVIAPEERIHGAAAGG